MGHPLVSFLGLFREKLSNTEVREKGFYRYYSYGSLLSLKNMYSI